MQTGGKFTSSHVFLRVISLLPVFSCHAKRKIQNLFVTLISFPLKLFHGWYSPNFQHTLIAHWGALRSFYDSQAPPVFHIPAPLEKFRKKPHLAPRGQTFISSLSFLCMSLSFLGVCADNRKLRMPSESIYISVTIWPKEKGFLVEY